MNDVVQIFHRLRSDDVVRDIRIPKHEWFGLPSTHGAAAVLGCLRHQIRCDATEHVQALNGG